MLDFCPIEQKEDMKTATLGFSPKFDRICEMFEEIVDIMVRAVVETPRVEQGLFQVKTIAITIFVPNLLLLNMNLYDSMYMLECLENIKHIFTSKI